MAVHKKRQWLFTIPSYEALVSFTQADKQSAEGWIVIGKQSASTLKEAIEMMVSELVDRVGYGRATDYDSPDPNIVLLEPGEYLLFTSNIRNNLKAYELVPKGAQ